MVALTRSRFFFLLQPRRHAEHDDPLSLPPGRLLHEPPHERDTAISLIDQGAREHYVEPRRCSELVLSPLPPSFTIIGTVLYCWRCSASFTHCDFDACLRRPFVFLPDLHFPLPLMARSFGLLWITILLAAFFYSIPGVSASPANKPAPPAPTRQPVPTVVTNPKVKCIYSLVCTMPDFSDCCPVSASQHTFAALAHLVFRCENRWNSPTTAIFVHSRVPIQFREYWYSPTQRLSWHQRAPSIEDQRQFSPGHASSPAILQV